MHSRDAASLEHYEIWKYYPSTSKAHATVLQNLVVWSCDCTGDEAVWFWQAPSMPDVAKSAVSKAGRRAFWRMLILLVHAYAGCVQSADICEASSQRQTITVEIPEDCDDVAIQVEIQKQVQIKLNQARLQKQQDTIHAHRYGHNQGLQTRSESPEDIHCLSSSSSV